MAAWIAALLAMRASPQGKELHVMSSLIPPIPESKVCAVFSNRHLSPISRKQPKSIATQSMFSVGGVSTHGHRYQVPCMDRVDRSLLMLLDLSQ